MSEPCLPRHDEFLKRCEKYGIETDLNKRWMEGKPHHPKSEAVFYGIECADWLFGNDYFGWKSGGDGDNGEILMDLMDIYFELNDAEMKGGGKCGRTANAGGE